MATLSERFETDYKTAMKAGDRVRVDTLRMVKAALQRVAIDKRKDVLDDADIIPVLNQQVKQRRETLEAGQKAGRQDVVDSAKAELDILSGYLPKQLSPEQLKPLIEEAIASVGPQQGPIMKFVMAKAAGAADGKTVNQLVAERLKQS
ncbi:MAG: GatB/YqeY domain-containing protein [Candidatus Omnitrophica bacterium]|nr:GatB/YqeY domain-containing protein [Candidatus Omnitrophota bacterium]